MTTTKQFGCGGRYSAYRFNPCKTCSAGNLAACVEIQKVSGLAHYEWHTDLKGMAKWKSTRARKNDFKDGKEMIPCPNVGDSGGCDDCKLNLDPDECEGMRGL